MPYFLTVIVLDLTKVTCRLIQTIFIIVFFLGLTRLGCIDFCSRGKASSLLSAKLSALLLLRPIGGLFLLLLLGSSFLRPSLRFIPFSVFHENTLRTSLSRVGLAAVQTSFVHILDI